MSPRGVHPLLKQSEELDLKRGGQITDLIQEEGFPPWPDGTRTRKVRSEGFRDSTVNNDSRHLIPLPQASPGARLAPIIFSDKGNR